VDQLSHLGSGYPLYFKFIIYCIKLLVIMMITSGLYNLISNIAEGDCSSAMETTERVYCLKGYIISFSLSNKRDNPSLLQVQLVLNLLTVIIIMVFFHVLRYHFRKMEIEADMMTLTPSDFTIEIQNISRTATNKEIEEWIMKFGNEKQPLNIKRIVRTYDINKYVKLVNKKKALEVKKAQLNCSQNGEVCQGKKEKIDLELEKVSTEIKEMKDSGTLQKCPVVYITFETPQGIERFYLTGCVNNNRSSICAKEISTILYKRVFTSIYSVARRRFVEISRKDSRSEKSARTNRYPLE